MSAGHFSTTIHCWSHKPHALRLSVAAFDNFCSLDLAVRANESDCANEINLFLPAFMAPQLPHAVAAFNAATEEDAAL